MSFSTHLFHVNLIILMTTGKSFLQIPPLNSRSSFINTQENARLLGYVISIQRTSGTLSCAQECLRSHTCASFNYEMRENETGSRGMCELNRYDAVTMATTGPVKEKGWVFGYLRDKYWKQPKDYIFTFTTLGATGAVGPVDVTGYKGTSLEGKIRLDRGIQIWSVPTRGTYTIEVLGASGANGTNNTGVGAWKTGGKGARIKGTFYLIEETTLKILVGQVGIRVQQGDPQPGGGGGGSFVTLQDGTPLIVAGGGGGGGTLWVGHYPGLPGETSEEGSIHGGTSGSGGRLWDIYHNSYDMRFPAGAGGGLLTDGASGTNATGGGSFVNGGRGGLGVGGSEGGFGGGGASFCFAGGGGGYSGGGVKRGTRYAKSGGGGSFNAGTREEASVRTEKGPGEVIIILTSPDIG